MPKLKNIKLILLIIIVFNSFSVYAQVDLNYFISKAKSNSPLLNDIINQNKAFQYDIDRLRSQYTKPQIGITAGYLFAPIISKDNNRTTFQPNPEGATNYKGYDLANSNGGIYQALININQPLFNGRNFNIASQQLLVSSQINQNNAKLTEHDIEKIVTDQYILCLQDTKQLQYSESMVKLLADQKSILIKLVESSIYKQSDFSLLNIEHQNFLLQYASLKASYRRDLMDLNILCGINDTALLQLQNVDLTLTNTFSNSMYLEKYRLDSLNLISQQKAFELKYKPQLSLYANSGLNAVYAPTIPNRFGVSAGLNFTYNFFDGKQKESFRNKTQVLEQTVSFYKSNFTSQNTLRKSKIIVELQSYTERISIAEQQLKEYDFLLNSYKKEIVSGQISIINYILILKNMATFQRDYTLLFSQQQTLINAYNYWNW